MPKSLGRGLVLAVALGNAALAQGWTKFDGQYVGELTLAGIVEGNCMRPPSGALYPLTISGGQVHFKYVPRFDTILTGKVDQNGNFKAGRKLRHGFVTMTGHISGQNLTADIVSPSCNYTFKVRN
ncbi:MAG TPA: hypothetical protein VG651_20325 [Stellaceae bacterium]|nr:hypothetical protein [Stellaceae bacterium]